MSLFRQKQKLKPDWVFSQTGNLWRFIFGGEKYIVGETRDLNNRIVYFFVIDITTGKTLLKDFLFENGNYWISIEGANSKYIFLHRYDKPELPYHKNIIALNIQNGQILWENEDYIYLLNTEEKLYGIKQKFESYEIAEINLDDGKLKNIIPESGHSEIYNLREKSSDLQSEFSDYPINFSEEKNENISDIIKKETGNQEIKGDIEFILKNRFIVFNYYVPAGIDMTDLNHRFYENRLCIFDIKTGEKIYTDVLNKKSTYNVPDNFFTRNNYLFYLREKKELVSIKLN